jgi:hypothetical protein
MACGDHAVRRRWCATAPEESEIKVFVIGPGEGSTSSAVATSRSRRRRTITRSSRLDRPDEGEPRIIVPSGHPRSERKRA